MDIEQLRNKVHEMVKHCLFAEEDIENGRPKNLGDLLHVEGLVRNFGFHKGRVQESKEDLRALLKGIVPEEFLKDGGGGMSFLNFCMTKDGEQWGEHPDMEVLFCLAKAAGLGDYCLPKSIWAVLPGGMPYIYFDLN